MRKAVIITIIILFLVSCTPSSEAIQKAIARTQTALPTNTLTVTPTFTPEPTPTMTPVPLSLINLEDILLLEGDLPEGFVGDSVGKYTNNPILENISGQEQMVIQEFSKTNVGIGVVAVYLFEEDSDVIKAYEIAKGKLEEGIYNGEGKINEVGDFGERRDIYFKYVFGRITTSSILFTRCNAFIYMGRTNDDEESSTLTAFAKKLDDRLSGLICR